MSKKPNCEHTLRKLLCLDAGRGGLQYRSYCAHCWECMAGPIAHDQVARDAVAAGRRPRLHTDGSVVWAPVITAEELERRRATGRRST